MPAVHTAALELYYQQVSRAARRAGSMRRCRRLGEQQAAVFRSFRGVLTLAIVCCATLMLAVTGAGVAAEAAGTADSASQSSGIPAAYNTTSSSKNAIDSRRRSTDCASTSYPTTSYTDDWDALGACMTTAMEMEACVDAVVRP
jgi:hypothetical protein